jgi:hypothetical protein
MTQRIIRLSAAVMTHPSRLPHARALQDRHPELGLRIVVDPAPEEGPSTLRTARLAWRSVADDATHHLVVQDDARLCDAFLACLTAALTAMPDRAVCLFTEWGSETSHVARLAALFDASWAEVVDHYIPSVALVLPIQLARAFGQGSAGSTPDDVALRTFLMRMGVKAFVAVPNLVDHRQVQPSLTMNDYMGPRRSVCFPPAPTSEVIWSSRVFEPGVVPFFSFLEGRPLCLVRQDEAGRSWRRVTPYWLLRSHDLDADYVIALGRATVAPLLGHSLAIRPDLLFGLWVTAFQHGVQLADTAGQNPVDLDAALARSTASCSLATMPAGALRMFVPMERLASLAAKLSQLVTCGVRQGFEMLREIRSDGAARRLGGDQV